MKISTSYFYQIRNFSPDMIPISTAKWDPKWYRPIHIDENGVINGLRLQEFSPGPTCDELCHGTKDCKLTPDKCPFLESYKKQIDSLMFSRVIRNLNVIVTHAKEILGIPDSVEPHIILMVYETPSNKCSEREVIQQYFQNHGIDCQELEYPIKKYY